jgi:hypothetical protein
MAHQSEGQRAEEGQKERLPRPSNEQQWIHAERMGRHERQQAVADSEQDRRRRKHFSPLPHPVDDHAGRGLHQEHAQAGERDGEANGRLRPQFALEEGTEKRHDDAGDLGQEEIGRVQADLALPGDRVWRRWLRVRRSQVIRGCGHLRIMHSIL